MNDTDDQSTPERGDAAHWLGLIEDAEKAFQAWQNAADSIDKAYGQLSELRSMSRDRQFQLFWSNIQVMGPSIYARQPVPVVSPKFKDRRPLYRTASELLERACVVSFDLADIDGAMLSMRDDLAIVGRGAAWVRYESDDDGERVCYEHVDRKDFLHEPARKWSEVDWAAKRAWLTHDEMKERFGAAADDVEYETRKGETLGKVEKCGVWEIWCKSQDKVVWVTEGAESVLEEGKPHLKLNAFFPCPKPAYASLERRTLIPVPDMLFYKDQLEEVNDLTRRIHALADAIKVRGFYAGSGDIGDAIERAIKMTDDEQILIPVPAMQSLMQGGGDPIVWLPLDLVASTITGLIDLRRQVIDDVYQIIGLSDIMRGSTVASETLGAQQLKQQNGSYRVRDKQNELVRVARDLVRIGAEIMSTEFSDDTLTEMAQMDLPTNASVKAQVKHMTDAAKAELEELAAKAEDMAQQAQQGPPAAPQQGQQQQGQPIDPQQAQQQFEQAQQAIIGKWQPQIKQASEAVTIEAVMEFLKDEKLRPFALDIETDSTIYPDEMAEKQSRQEFMGAFSASMAALQPMFMMGPEAIAVAGGVFKFALSPYRVGRELEGLIDDFTDKAPDIAKQMQAQNKQGQDEGLAAAQMKLAEAEMAKVQSQTEANTANAQLKMQELSLKAQEAQSKAQEGQQKFSLEVESTKGAIAETEARIQKIYAEIQKMGVDAQNQARQQDREDVKTVADVKSRAIDQAMSAQNQAHQAQMGERQQMHNETISAQSEARADRGQQFNEQSTEADREFQRQTMKETPNG